MQPVQTASHGSDAPFRFRARRQELPAAAVGLNTCPSTYDVAVDAEMSLTSLITSHNYQVSTIFALSHSSPDYAETCTNDDANAYAGWYEGGNLSPWETLFIKTRWAIESEWVDKLSAWLDGAAGVPKGGGNVYAGTWKGRSWQTCSGP